MRPACALFRRNDVRDGKPDPEPYLRAAWLAGLDPEDARSWKTATPAVLRALRRACAPYSGRRPHGTGPAGALNADSAEAVRAYLGLS